MDIPAYPISIGDTLQYRINLGRKTSKHCKGVIIDKTKKFIVVDLGPYRDTILYSDLITGQVEIIKGGRNMAIEKPPKEYLRELFEKSGRMIIRAAEACDPPVSGPTMAKWLRKEGIIPPVKPAKTSESETKSTTLNEPSTPDEPDTEEHPARGHEIVKKMVDFLCVPLYGRIANLERRLAQLEQEAEMQMRTQTAWFPRAELRKEVEREFYSMLAIQIVRWADGQKEDRT